MKRITLLCMLFIACYSWQGHAQFAESFDTEIPTTWTVVDQDGQGYTWVHSTAYPYQGAGHARLHWEANAHEDYLISPQFTVTTGVADRVSFYAGSDGTFYVETFDVKLSTTGTAPADFTVTLGSETATGVASNDDYIQYIYDLSAYDGQVVYIAIVGTATNQFYLAVDEFRVDTVPSCPQPTGLTATGITATTADLGWTPGGTEAAWNVEIVPAGTLPTETATATGVTNPYPATLDPATDYDFYVQADCTGGDLSYWSGPYSFTTLCATYALPFAENFDAYLPNCWEVASSGDPTTGPSDFGSSSWNSDEFLNTGTNMAVNINLYGSNKTEWLISPSIDISSGASELAYMVATTDYGNSDPIEGGMMGTDDEVQVLLSEDDGVTWTNLMTYNAANSPSNTGDMATIDLSAYTGTVKIAFWASEGTVNDDGTYDYDFFIDGFEVRALSTCPQPTGLTATGITATTADLGWTPGGTEAAWNVEIVPAGTLPTETATATGVTNPYPATLDPATDYDFYVQADCTGGDLSYWSGPYSFTTLCATYALPFAENFDAYVPNCWEVASSGDPTTGPSDFGSSSWSSDEFLNTGTNMAVNVNLYSTGKEEWLISPSIDLSSGAAELTYMVATTDYANSDPIEGGMMGTDDEVQVLLSEDDGVTWTNLMSYNAANSPSNTGDMATIDLSAYTGTVKIAFWASEGTVDDDSTYDYDFFIDDIAVQAAGGGGTGTITAYGVNNATRELVSFDITDPTIVNVMQASSVTVNFGNAGAVDPNDPNTAYVLDDQGDFYSVALDAGGLYSFLGNIAAPGAEGWTGMEFDPSTGVLYAISSDGVTSTSTLSSIDIAGLSATNIGVTGMSLAISLAIDATGNMYAHDIVDDNLYSIDNTTGVATVVGPIGFNASYGQGMCWDSNTSTMFMAAFNETSFQAEWRSVDTATGATTLIGALGVSGTDQFGWVSIGPSFTLTCPEPTDLLATVTSETSADITWTAGGSETAWEIEYGLTGFSLGSGTIVADTDGTIGETISSLAPGTEYEVYVTAICGPGDESFPAGPITFVTPCTAITSFPFEESFEDASLTRDCWTNEYVVDAFDWDYVSTNGDDSVAPRTGTLMAEFRNTTMGSATKLVSPPFDLTSLTNPQLTFYYANVNWFGDIDELRVYYKTSASGAWIQIGSDYIAEHTSWTGVTLSLPDPSSEYYIAFEATSNWARGMNLDDVTVQEASSCPAPSDIVIGTITYDTAVITWTENGTAVEWEIEYGLAGFAPGTGAGTVVTDNDGTLGETLTSLTAETDYDVYVTAICGAGDESAQVGPGSFTTTDMGVEDQVFEGFSYYPNPVSSSLSLKATSEIQQVVVYDLLGQEVLKTQPNSLTPTLELNNLQTGAYFMKVTINGTEGTYRFIKE